MVVAERADTYHHRNHHSHQSNEMAEHDHCQGNMDCVCDHQGHCCCCANAACSGSNCNCHGGDA